jgi:hypothetical protein
MPEIITRADLEQLIEEQLQESLVLDYKRSDALSRSDNRKKDELGKDVSAFANSAGGQLIYGIEENGNVPTRIDEGVSVSEITKEWIEQVLSTTVQPKIEGLRIQQIPLSEGQAAYVITIPAATSRAPHQARDKRYYRRYNFESVPMEDYEVRDALRRADRPEPYLEFEIERHTRPLSIPPHQNQTPAVPINVYVSNRSSSPALYTKITIHIKIPDDYHGLEFNIYGFHHKDENENLIICKYNISVPQYFPLFKETREYIGHISPSIPASLFHRPGWKIIPISYFIQTPGFSDEAHGHITLDPAKMLGIDWKSAT